jgi:flavin-dependent dehydrogenase
VLGAGPAGSLAARELAGRGLQVLLVDVARFPRPKVCGGCLNRVSLAALERAGLGEVPAQLGAPRLTTLLLAAGGQKATIPLARGAACSRAALDAALARKAAAAGAAFLDGTRGTIAHIDEGTVGVTLHGEDGNVAVKTRIVIAATGLAGGFLRDESRLSTVVAKGSRVGAGTLIPGEPGAYPAGIIHMAHGRSGYVGLTAVEDGRLNVGAALDPEFIRERGGLGTAAAAILLEAGFPIPNWLAAARWRGTPRLTVRRRPVALRRVFILGDAAGYEEPFTGEGMGWAMSSALALAPLAARAARSWEDSMALRWERTYQELVGRRARLCHLVAAGLRRDGLTRAAVRVLRTVPALAAPLVWAINDPPSPPQACAGTA